MITNADVLQAIRDHGAATYPEECCGFLLGTVSTEGNVVQTIHRIENAQEENRERRFLMGPGDFLKADRAARQLGLDVVGTYHSHPDHPAQPSATDLEHATFPGFTYIIVSVQQGVPGELTTWSLAPDRSCFEPEFVRLTAET